MGGIDEGRQCRFQKFRGAKSWTINKLKNSQEFLKNQYVLNNHTNIVIKAKRLLIVKILKKLSKYDTLVKLHNIRIQHLSQFNSI